MRKIFVLFLLVALLLTAGGCTYSPEFTKNDDLFNVPASSYADGTYTAHSKYYSPYGYGLQLRIEVNRGIITRASFKEINADGEERVAVSDHVSWNTQTLSQIYASLYTDFIEKQNASVDTVSSATETSDAFKKLAEAVTENAVNGTNADTVVNDFNWTYTARNAVASEPDTYTQLTVSYDNDTITQVLCETVRADGSKITSGSDKQAFALLARDTLDSQSLSEITASSVAPSTLETYNALLDAVEKQRSLFIPSGN